MDMWSKAAATLFLPFGGVRVSGTVGGTDVEHIQPQIPHDMRMIGIAVVRTVIASDDIRAPRGRLGRAVLQMHKAEDEQDSNWFHLMNLPDYMLLIRFLKKDNFT
jgi:hypothetical protein